MSRFIHLEDENELLEAYFLLSPLKTDYPAFGQWYWQTVREGIKAGNRSILAAIDDARDCISGLAIIKAAEEKKISTLYVRDDCRGQGLGSILLNRAIFELHTEKPLITVASSHILEYDALLKDAGFAIKATYPDYYNVGSIEYAFNGYLHNECRWQIA